MDFRLIRQALAVIPTDLPTQPVIPAQFQTFKGVLAAVINVVFYVGVALTIIFLIIGGIKYITSGGSKEGTEAARGMITNAIIGFIVVIGSFTIKKIIEGMLGVTAVPDILPPF